MIVCILLADRRRYESIKEGFAMRVELLGTAAAEGWPGLFCDCGVCTYARVHKGKDVRTRSSLLIDRRLKIDFPPDTFYHTIAHNIELRTLQALLFTHAHDDHFCPAELQYSGVHFVSKLLEHPLPIYGPPEVIETLCPMQQKSALPLELHTLCAWKTETIAGYKVTPIMAHHDPAITCFNYVLRDAQGTTLLYASDTGWYDEQTWSFLLNCKLDAVVVECTKGPINGEYGGHMSISDVVKMKQWLLENDVIHLETPIVATHFSHNGGFTHEQLEAALGKAHIVAAYDGYVLNVGP
jgi:phosphoribosyl 1,2-cyclic phosphate phosphodiesterase